MKVTVFGYGAMGKLLCERLQADEQTQLVAAIAPTAEGNPSWVYPSITQVQEPYELLIDFSHPDNSEMILETAIAKNIPVVLCTTGHSAAQLAAIKSAAQQVPIVLASNTSQGVNLMHQLLQKAVQVLAQDFDIEPE